MTRTNVSKLSRLERSFVAETQGPPEIPPRVPAAVVGSINHHDLDAHRYPEPPFGGPTVDGESIGHQEGTVSNHEDLVFVINITVVHISKTH